MCPNWRNSSLALLWWLTYITCNRWQNAVACKVSVRSKHLTAMFILFFVCVLSLKLVLLFFGLFIHVLNMSMQCTFSSANLCRMIIPWWCWKWCCSVVGTLHGPNPGEVRSLTWGVGCTKRELIWLPNLRTVVLVIIFVVVDIFHVQFSLPTKYQLRRVLFTAKSLQWGNSGKRTKYIHMSF